MFYKKCCLTFFAIFTEKHLCWSLVLIKRDSNTSVFLWISQNFNKHLFENICEWLVLRNSPVLSIIIFQIHTKLLLHVQLSLLRNILRVNILTIQFTSTNNIKNMVKQFENLKKKLKGINTYSSSTVPVKICAK